MIYEAKYKSHPLMSWDLSGRYYWEGKSKAKVSHDLKTLTKFSQDHKWVSNLEEVLSESYEALVLTDANQIIRWVNNGFYSMTGYPADYAIGRSPKFLQGEKTSRRSLQNIGNKLLNNEPFTEIITNYRRNHEEYLCEVTIYPLLNENEEVMHYLALENELK